MNFKFIKSHENGVYFLVFTTKMFKLKWFTDYGFWFVYIHFGKRFYRVSNNGCLSGKTK